MRSSRFHSGYAPGSAAWPRVARCVSIPRRVARSRSIRVRSRSNRTAETEGALRDTVIRPSGDGLSGGAQSGEGTVAPEQFDGFEQRRRYAAASDCDPDRGERDLGLEAEAFDERGAQGFVDGSGGPVREAAQCFTGGLEDGLGLGCEELGGVVGLDGEAFLRCEEEADHAEGVR